MGLTPLNQGGFSVYGLFDQGATKPYYIGISNDLERRLLEHIKSGRFNEDTGQQRVLKRDLRYDEARGYEQAYIEKYGTKTGTIGESVSPTNRGNKINSFDKTRADERGKAFNQRYEDAQADINSKELPKCGQKMNDNKSMVYPGDVYFIPLFLQGESSAKSFARYKFGGDEQDFCFFRVIDDYLGSGILIEIFNCVGGVESDVSEIISSERLFKPIYIAGEGISKKRWRKVGETKDYDKETHSNYSSIQFLIGFPGEFRLWCNGIEYKVDASIDKLENIEEHIILTSKQVEKRVLKALGRL